MNTRVLLLTLAAALVPAALPAAEGKLQVVEMGLTPAPVPSLALKYQLLPDFLDRTPGDAVPLYLKAMARELVNREASAAFFKEVQAWLGAPPAKLPLDEVKKTLAPFDAMVRQLTAAARRSECRWDPPLREEANPYAILLPELQDFRNFGRVLAVRIHLAIAERRYDAALGDLQTGYAMARHVGQMPFVVSSLVGSAIATLMNNELEAFVQSPGAPNLFWAVSTMPQPIIDFRPGYELERSAIYLMLPQMRASPRAGAVGERKALSQATIDRMVELAKSLAPEPDLQKLSEGQALAELTTKARAELIAHGHPAKQVEAMSPAQALAVDAFEGYDEYRDELFKWLALPYPQARTGIDQAEARLEVATKARSPRAMLAGMVLPALGRTKFAEAGQGRQLTALATVEALRAHAATTGRLPATLADIQDLPLPTNPVTGRPFPYRLEKDVAILLADGPEDRNRTEYRVRLK